MAFNGGNVNLNVNVNSNFVITLSNIANNRVVVWIKNSHSVCAVSYTHLDVYKRQAIMLCAYMISTCIRETFLDLSLIHICQHFSSDTKIEVVVCNSKQ